MTAIRVRGLRAGYRDAPVVRDLDLDVAAGEVVALLGPNGAGKTTHCWRSLACSSRRPAPYTSSGGRYGPAAPTRSPAAASPTCRRTARCSPV